MVTQSLRDKVAIITGAGSGIGREAALLFARQGAQIVVVDINGLTGEETVRLVKAAGGDAIYINANISRAEDCQNMMHTVEKAFSRVNILFNNAGVMHHQDGDIVDIEEKVWDLTLAVNLKSVFLSCKYAIPILVKSGGGSIINTSSFVALRGSAASNMAYGVSKAGIIALTQDLAARYAKKNIRVNTLCPGPTLTESFTRYVNESPELKTGYLNAIPMRQFATMQQIAEAAFFLASDASSYMTGSTLVVDGGITGTYQNS